MGEHKLRQSQVKDAKKKKGTWREGFMLFIYALLLALLLKAFVVDSRAIPSTSMQPTIEPGDRVVLSRLAYLGERAPQRGDIVVFKAPAETQEKSDMIKRVIGLPGEKVEIRDGMVYINDIALVEHYLNEAPDYVFGPVTVPEGCYFVLGDNRNHSVDSHAWLDPFLPEEDIKGKATVCYWPLDRIGGLYE